MIPLEEAQQYVVGRCEPLGAEVVGLRGAAGSVTAEAVSSPGRIPPFANTAVDGFAVRAADVAGASAAAPAVLTVVGTIAAGDAPTVPVGPGEAIRIMTGAPMPQGADAIVMVEWTTVHGDTVAVDRPLEPGDHVRGAGEDLEPGDLVFDVGTVLSAGHLGVLASIGRYEVAVVRRPRVGVFSTGDELIDGPGELAPGQIRDANRYTLVALAERDGYEVVDLGVIPDDEAAIEAAMRDAVSRCDAVLTSGGVSMGDYDYVKAVLDRIGDMRWMQIAIKPAKPLAFGFVDGVPLFGLPGNPVSSMVSYELFAAPALRAMAGHPEPVAPLLRGTAAVAWPRRPDGKTHFARALAEVVDGRWQLRSAGGQGSHQLTAMAGADALAVLPDGDGYAAGDDIWFMSLR